MLQMPNYSAYVTLKNDTEETLIDGKSIANFGQ